MFIVLLVKGIYSKVFVTIIAAMHLQIHHYRVINHILILKDKKEEAIDISKENKKTPTLMNYTCNNFSLLHLQNQPKLNIEIITEKYDIFQKIIIKKILIN